MSAFDAQNRHLALIPVFSPVRFQRSSVLAPFASLPFGRSEYLGARPSNGEILASFLVDHNFISRFRTSGHVQALRYIPGRSVVALFNCRARSPPSVTFRLEVPCPLFWPLCVMSTEGTPQCHQLVTWQLILGRAVMLGELVSIRLQNPSLEFLTGPYSKTYDQLERSRTRLVNIISCMESQAF